MLDATSSLILCTSRDGVILQRIAKLGNRYFSLTCVQVVTVTGFSYWLSGCLLVTPL